jgi:hypothetical protein
LIETPASILSARVHSLIARHHAGDCRAAAAQLGIEHDALAAMLTSDWRQFSLRAIAVIVRAYDVTPAWLLAASIGAELPVEAIPADVLGLVVRGAAQPPA